MIVLFQMEGFNFFILNLMEVDDEKYITYFILALCGAEHGHVWLK
jgi:hypothetical protein